MRYLNIVGEINELGLESILEKISEFREEELEFIETMLESGEFTREDAVALLGPIAVNISTFGGIIDTGFAILDALSTLESPIYTRANGYCMSTGLLLLLAGDHRECGPYTTFMYHTIAYGCEGPLARHKAQVLASKDVQKRFDSIITEKTSITDRQLKKYVNGEWYLNPEQALNLGLVHTIR